MKTKLFTTWGYERQGCGHAHRTIAAAQLCVRDDREKCKEEGRSSDREVRAIKSTLEAVTYDKNNGPGVALEKI